ncbi:hypothetical protein MIND_01314500 [Mycena indigotica]|uniref:Uncharacterized protein n=1 Tax=Mycena indigotica TaxID=2126181 RepID=A0A8H6S1S0_9AGAR|nr:uncharacterized protein MIND_01314500 [Mycena indigotica]KAF7290738.1 hypothetical protein MIND_01314500 [Mycena indigotica]
MATTPAHLNLTHTPSRPHARHHISAPLVYRTSDSSRNQPSSPRGSSNFHHDLLAECLLVTYRPHNENSRYRHVYRHRHAPDSPPLIYIVIVIHFSHQLPFPKPMNFLPAVVLLTAIVASVLAAPNKRDERGLLIAWWIALTYALIICDCQYRLLKAATPVTEFTSFDGKLPPFPRFGDGYKLVLVYN